MAEAERFVLLGLAPARAGWFDAVAQWSMSASIAAEFVKCVSADEVRARLESGRQHSALLIDAAAPALDRDLVDVASDWATPVIVVGDRGPAGLSRRDIGFAADLPAVFSPAELMDVLTNHCRPVGRGALLPPPVEEAAVPIWSAPLYAVCGAGGTGASTVAIALAQGLAADVRFGRQVLLADLALRAEQAMLHDSTSLGPGVQELVDAHRLRRPMPEEIAGFTYDVPTRGYRLLLGLRYPHAWTALRPRATEAALSGLRHSFQAIVADIDGDVEGESQTGSADVEDRNRLARTTALNATVVLVVLSPGLKGIHSGAALIRRLVEAGVAAQRILPAINRSHRHPQQRAESASALASLLGSTGSALTTSGPLHLPERKLDDLLRDGAPLPQVLARSLSKATLAVAERVADRPPAMVAAERIVPGSLGAWSEPDDA